MSWSLILVVLTVLVFWALGAYNRLVRLRMQVCQSLQQLLSIWHAQAQALHERLQDYAQGRQTASQWMALDQDAPRWLPLSQATHQFLACLAPLQQRPHEVPALDDVSALHAARSILEQAWQRLKNEQEDLAGEPVPPEINLIWAQHEGHASRKLTDYNEAVQAYHDAIGQFPALLMAWLCGFGMTGKLE